LGEDAHAARRGQEVLRARRKAIRVPFLVVAFTASLGLPPATAITGTTTRVSVASDGSEGNATSYCSCSVSADGRYVAFPSDATNLSGGSAGQVVVRDRQTGTTTTGSLTAGGGIPNKDSTQSALSADGRYLAFASEGPNVVPGDTNNGADIFLRDRMLGTTVRVSVSSMWVGADAMSLSPSISADGRYVAFTSWASNLVPSGLIAIPNVYVRDVVAGTTTLIGPGGLAPAISADGHYVAFYSHVSTLVAGDTNGVGDAFVKDFLAGTISRVSISSSGQEGDAESFSPGPPAISADGRYVAFESLASNFAPADTNDAEDVFVRDRVAGTTIRATVSSAGPGANFNSGVPSLSADGRYIAYMSYATNLVPGDMNVSADVFVHDRVSGATSLASVSYNALQGNGDSGFPQISGDGRSVVFWSTASNLVQADGNRVGDVFVRDWLTAPTQPRSARALAGPNVGEITLLWNPPLTDGGGVVTEYRVYRAMNRTGPFDLRATVAPTETSFIDSGLEALRTYYYLVTALNGFGESPNSLLACSKPFPWLIVALGTLCSVI
jgi:Tol biopolymer transport system component